MSWVLAGTSTILLELYDIAEAASRVESLVEVMAGAASGRCRLELYRDPALLDWRSAREQEGGK